MLCFAIVYLDLCSIVSLYLIVLLRLTWIYMGVFVRFKVYLTHRIITLSGHTHFIVFGRNTVYHLIFKEVFQLVGWKIIGCDMPVGAFFTDS